MKLSKMTTDQAADALCEMTPYIANIMSDEELLSELRGAIDATKANTRAEMLALAAEKVSKVVSVIMKKRRNDLFGILSALNGKTHDEICGQNVLVTMVQVREIFKDKELLDFFRSCVGSEGNE